MADFESKYTGEEAESLLDKMAGLTDEDGYVYSAGEKVDMRFTRSLLPVGTSIPANANLNTIEYMKIGKYYCSQNVDAKTVKNCPVNMAFSMEVFNPLSTNVDDETTADYTYRLRVLTPYNTGVHYMQCCRTSGTPGTWTYDSWYVTPRSKFALASSKNDGSAAIGASNKGVYIDSDGEIKAMSYTIAKSVPSNAVFTDTKVTAVGNHYAPAEDDAEQIDAPEGEVVTGIKRDAAGHVVGVVSAPQTGGGSGGITVETDPVFSVSPAASITEAKKTEWDNKVDKVSGKQLSTQDFTTELEGKLKGIEANAQKNVQSDWNENDRGSDAYVNNRTHYSYDIEQVTSFSIASKNEGDILVTGLQDGAFYRIYNDESGNNEVFHFVEGWKVVIPSNGPTIEAVCAYEDDYCLKLTTPTYGMTESFVLKEIYVEQLDDVYIPETIARKAKTVQQTSLDTLMKVANANAVETDNLIYAFPDQATGEEDDVLLSRGTVKTINGQTIMYDGDSDDIITTYRRITTTSPSVELLPNTIIEWPMPIRSQELVLTFGEQPSQGYAVEYIAKFNVGADGVQLIVPSNVVWADGVYPAMTNGKTYEISFVDNLATFLEF